MLHPPRIRGVVHASSSVSNECRCRVRHRRGPAEGGRRGGIARRGAAHDARPVLLCAARRLARTGDAAGARHGDAQRPEGAARRPVGGGTCARTGAGDEGTRRAARVRDERAVERRRARSRDRDLSADARGRGREAVHLWQQPRAVRALCAEPADRAVSRRARFPRIADAGARCGRGGCVSAAAVRAAQGDRRQQRAAAQRRGARRVRARLYPRHDAEAAGQRDGGRGGAERDGDEFRHQAEGRGAARRPRRARDRDRRARRPPRARATACAGRRAARQGGARCGVLAAARWRRLLCRGGGGRDDGGDERGRDPPAGPRAGRRDRRADRRHPEDAGDDARNRRRAAGGAQQAARPALSQHRCGP